MSNTNKTKAITTSELDLDLRVDPHAKTPPCLVLISGSVQHMGHQWRLEKEKVTIGRMDPSDIQIEEGGLSKVHASFTSKDERVYVTDLGSTNKTSVNGQALAPHQPFLLRNNDQVRAGNLMFKFLQKGLLSETSEKERMQTELENARNIQASLFPAQNEAVYHDVKIAGRYRPATEMAGDWWWHWTTTNHAFVLIGDATGHGAGAALITSAARSAIAVVEDDDSAKLEKVYSVLSRALQKCAGGTVLMTSFLVELDFAKKKLRYINASHTPAMLIPLEGPVPAWNELTQLTGEISSTLGTPDLDCVVHEIDMPVKSRLLLWTDGISERREPNGSQLTDRHYFRMIASATEAHRTSQLGFIDALLKLSDERAGNTVQDDDITLVTLDF